jgi:hypothetical protein
VRVAYDSSTNQIIAHGAKDLIGMLDEVVEALDRKPDEDGAAAEVSMRLVWLVSANSGAGRAIPQDLDDVVAELQRIGIGDLRLASQSLIRVSSEQSFQANFVANLATPWQIMLEGAMFTGDRASRRLSIDLVGQPTDGSGIRTRLETTITTVSGHFVVLGATPIEAMDSVFVVQLTDIP